VNSDIAASTIGNVHLASVLTTNSVPFGVVAANITNSIMGVSVKSPSFKWHPNGTDDQSLGDFHVELK
jgi:hypothetical protein